MIEYGLNSAGSLWTENQQLAFRLVGEIGPAIAQGVGALLVRHLEGLSHADPGRDVPRAARCDARGLPELLLLLVGSRFVATRDERRLRRGELLEGVDRRSSPWRSLAGSAGGPTMTKSLYITARRFTPKPASTNASSRAGACDSTTSTSPFSPSFIALPLPTAITSTFTLKRCSNGGRIAPSRPVFSVLVVVASRRWAVRTRCRSARGGTGQ